MGSYTSKCSQSSNCLLGGCVCGHQRVGGRMHCDTQRHGQQAQALIHFWRSLKARARHKRAAARCCISKGHQVMGPGGGGQGTQPRSAIASQNLPHNQSALQRIGPTQRQEPRHDRHRLNSYLQGRIFVYRFLQRFMGRSAAKWGMSSPISFSSCT